MATNSISPTSSQTSSRSATAVTPTDIAHTILTPLASLRLTVGLLFLSVLITFLITLQQSSRDMWEIKKEHFSALVVEVPIQSVVVERWFPDAPPIPGRFLIPSGFSLIVLLLMNLTAAHLLRFRLQSSGKRLFTGIVIAVLGALFTWAIVFNTRSATTFQGDPPISYRQMWNVLRGALGLLVGAGLVGFFAIGKGKRVEKILMAALTLIVIIAFGAIVLLGEKAFIGNEGMRIVWQLAQATAAGLVCLVASVLMFRRKGGMVILHLGIAGLLANEIYVSVTNEESRMQMVEGETVSTAIDIRSTELAIIDQSDPENDRIITVPENKLAGSDGSIKHPELPFNIEVLRFVENAELVKKIPNQDSGIVSDGVLSGYTALAQPNSNSASSDQGTDLAAAWVRLTEKETLKPLGTYLVSQIGYLNDLVDSIEVADKSYQLALRFKTNYKPYSLTLKDVQAKMYPGTETPRWFSSDFLLNDRLSETQSDQRVFMNNPLRYAGETFYQTGYDTDPTTGKEMSTLQIVKNKGWMIPYVCCMFVVVGLIAQFGMSLLSFLEKKQKQIDKSQATLSPELQAPPKLPIWKRSPLALGLVALMALYGVKDLARSTMGTEKHESMRLDLLGQVPITFNGRVQPLYSMARNTLRTLTKREYVYDGNNEKQTAMRWLADVMFVADGVTDYRLVRIEDPTVLDTLGLPRKFDEGLEDQFEALKSETNPEEKKALQAEIDRQLNRPSLRYTLKELADSRETIRSIIPKNLEPKNYNPLQARLSKTSSQIGKVQAIQFAFGGILQQNPDLEFEQRINLAMRSQQSGLPLLLPSTDSEKNWQTHSQSQDRNWVRSMAKRHDAETYIDLARKIGQVDLKDKLKDTMLASLVGKELANDPTLVDAAGAPSQVAQRIVQNWDAAPPALKEVFEKKFGPQIDANFDTMVEPWAQDLSQRLEKVGGLENDETTFDKYAGLFAKLGPAYRAQDADTFNSTLETYLAEIEQDALTGYSAGKNKAELIYGSAHFFVTAMVIFLIAFLVATLGWVGYGRTFNQASLWLLALGWIFLVVGLGFRIYISGRPPVTNLYSSVLFVTAIFVPLMMMVERMTSLGIGNVLGGMGAFLALMWAWTMSITDGDTFTVLLAVLDTQFWLATHVVCITIGYGTTFAAGALGVAYVVGAMLTGNFDKETRKVIYNAMYGMVCLALLFSFFGTVLGGLWGDDSWGRFWGWDPKENGALMIVLWNAISLHARWGGIVKARGFAMIAIFGNIVTLWSWKGVNALGVGLHAYGGSEDTTINVILAVGIFHLVVMLMACLPTRWWMSYARSA